MNRRRRYADTSASVFHARERERKTECELILTAMRSVGHSLTIKEIARMTGIVDSTVSARLAELRASSDVEEGLIKRKCTVNGIRKKVFGIAPQTGQLTLASALRKEVA